MQPHLGRELLVEFCGACKSLLRPLQSGHAALLCGHAVLPRPVLSWLSICEGGDTGCCTAAACTAVAFDLREGTRDGSKQREVGEALGNELHLHTSCHQWCLALPHAAPSLGTKGLNVAALSHVLFWRDAEN